MREFDQIIIGQGIAGSTLAWQLGWLGQHVVVVDREDANTASKVAAGLISPITGKRDAVSWRFDELWPVAKAFYERVESETKTTFFYPSLMLKVISVEDSRAGKVGEQLSKYVRQRVMLQSPLADSMEALEIAPAGRVDVVSYLAATREMLEQRTAYFRADVCLPDDLQLTKESVAIPKLGIQASQLVFCQGVAALTNPWFDELVFEISRGEILTLSVPKLHEERVVTDQVWLAPLEVSSGTYLAGATYDREFDRESIYSVSTTQAGREEIERKLAKFGPASYEVIDHRAALRPTIKGRLPKVGFSSQQKRLGVFNGLGSKGALRAPFVAQHFANYLIEQTNRSPLDAELSLRQPANTTGIRLTDQAHEMVAAALSSGDVAIDATAGNGFDTKFLSESVGPEGQVFAFDIQAEAITRTQAKLDSVGATNVTLFCETHAELERSIPRSFHGRVGAIMFNLGYLPRGDKDVVTKTQSTLAALNAGVTLLRPEGIVTIVAYTAHAGGLEETQAIEAWLNTLDRQTFEIVVPSAAVEAGRPRLYCIKVRPVA